MCRSLVLFALNIISYWTLKYKYIYFFRNLYKKKYIKVTGPFSSSPGQRSVSITMCRSPYPLLPKHGEGRNRKLGPPLGAGSLVTFEHRFRSGRSVPSSLGPQPADSGVSFGHRKGGRVGKRASCSSTPCLKKDKAVGRRGWGSDQR